ncbi:MAG TPA: hypothetical protein VN698_13775 [Bacteroidia bacterium]|nr:hypothetical protein [Bacteroidia bacterium]
MNKKALLFCFFLLTASLFGLDFYWSNWVKKQTSEKQIWILSKTNQHYNLAFIGASVVFTGIDIDTIEKRTKKTAINLGCDGAALMENYIVLKNFLQANNKIDTLYLQLDKGALMDMNKAFSYPFHDYLFLDKINDSDMKEAIIKSKGYLKYLCWNYLPDFKYAEFNNFYYPHIPFVIDRSAPVIDLNITHGSLLHDIRMPDGKAKNKYLKCDDKFEVDTTSIYYLNKILALCKQDNIKCVFFKTPVYYPYYNSLESSTIVANYIESFLNKRKCRFVDFQLLEMTKNEKYFKDDVHLNKDGAKLFSGFLADSLIRK